MRCRNWQAKYSKFTEALPTRAFLQPLDEDEEVEVEISKGNIINIKYRAVGELQSNGTRSVSALLSFCSCMNCGVQLSLMHLPGLTAVRPIAISYGTMSIHILSGQGAQVADRSPNLRVESHSCTVQQADQI